MAFAIKVTHPRSKKRVYVGSMDGAYLYKTKEQAEAEIKRHLKHSTPPLNARVVNYPHLSDYYLKSW